MSYVSIRGNMLFVQYGFDGFIMTFSSKKLKSLYIIVYRRYLKTTYVTAVHF